MSRVKGFRFDSELISNIEKESQRNGTNVNNFVKGVLERHCNAYMHLERLHYQWISKDLLRVLLKKAGDDDLAEIQKVLEEDLMMQQRYAYSDLNSQNIMNMILGNCNLQDIPFNETTLGDDSVKYNIVHGMGEKWGQILLGAIIELVNKANVKVDTINCNHQTISFVVYHNN